MEIEEAHTSDAQPLGSDHCDARIVHNVLECVRKASGLTIRDTIVVYNGDVEAQLNAAGGSDACVCVAAPAALLQRSGSDAQRYKAWGTDIYTPDSDLQTVAEHAGFLTPGVVPDASFPSDFRVAQAYEGHDKLSAYRKQLLDEQKKRDAENSAKGTSSEPMIARAVIFLLRPVPCPRVFRGSERNSVITGRWFEAENAQAPRFRFGMQIATVMLVKYTLDPEASDPIFEARPLQGARSFPAPSMSASERSVLYEYNDQVSFSLSFEPMRTYSLAAVADNGVDPLEWTSYKLRSEVLILESSTDRFEIAMEQVPQEGEEPKYGTFRISQLLCPCETTLAELQQGGLPAPASIATPLLTGLDWADLIWTEHTLRVSGRLCIPALRVAFLERA